MPCIPKGDIKARFKTGEKPTQQDFANLIDSFVETVNGIEPDTKGNVNIPDTSQKVQNNLEEHEKVVATSTVAGHIKVQNTIDDNTTNALTPSAVKSAIDAIEAAETLQNESIVNIQTGVEAVKLISHKSITTVDAMKTVVDRLERASNGQAVSLSNIKSDLHALNASDIEEKGKIDALNSGYSKLSTASTNHETSIAELQVSVKTNTDDIAALKTGGSGSPEDPTLSSKVTQNTNDIKDLKDTTASQALALNALDTSQNTQDADIKTLQTSVKTNTDSIATLKTKDTDLTTLRQNVDDNTSNLKKIGVKAEEAFGALTELISHQKLLHDNTGSLETEVVQLFTDVGSLSSRVTGLEVGTEDDPGVARLNESLKDLTKEVTANTVNIENKGNTINGIEADVKKLQDTVSKLNGDGNDITTLEADVKTNTDNVTTLQTSVKTNTDDIKTLKDAKTDLTDLKASVKTNTDDIKTLKDAKTDLTDLKASVKTNTDDIKKLKSDVDSANTALTVTIPAVVRTVSDVSDRVNTNTSDITNVKTSVTTNTADIKTLKDAKTDLTDLKASVKTNTDDVKQLKTDVSNNNALIKVNQKDLETYSLSLSTANASIKTNTTDIKTLKDAKTDLTDLKASVKTNTDDIATLTDKFKKDHATLVGVLNDGATRDIEIETLNCNMDDMTTLIQDIQAAIKKLQGS